MILTMLECALLFTLAGGNGAQDLKNGDFELKGSKVDAVPGWTVSIGARNGGEEPLSKVSLDRKMKRSGKRSLHLGVDRDTFGLQIVGQEVEARPGAIYRLSGHARTKNVRHEVNAKGIPQFNNCYLALFLFDGNGELVARDIATPSRPYTDDWEELSLAVEAPDSVRRAEVKMFLSISGDLWFDDLELAIEGGQAVPKPALVFRDDFESQDELAAAWLVEEGARNGGTEPVSTVEVDPRRGATKSKRSMHLAGSRKTLLWRSANRYFEATPGDVFELSAMVKARKIRSEQNALGIEQFANFHLRLVFFDEQDKILGAARFAHPGQGDYDWKSVAVQGTAPEGSVRGMAAIFLSMSGEAWLDDVELTRQTGGTPAYDGWLALDTEHLTIRYPADHPQARGMASYGDHMEEALAHIAATLETTVDEKITVFLYRNKEQGEALTGRPLAFAESERRAVHQDTTNTPGHELVHVVALALGYSQSGLLGEGIAVWLDGEPQALHHQRAAKLLAQGELPSMAALLDSFRAQEQGYPAAGSFTGWLLDTHGLDTLRRMYPRKDLDAHARVVLGQTMQKLDTAWREFLRALE